jgi:hypothetical protein
MTYRNTFFGLRIAFHQAMIMSLLTSLPETSSLFLMGTVLILAGLVLRRVFRMVEKGIAAISKRNDESRPVTLKLDREEALSRPLSPRL